MSIKALQESGATIRRLWTFNGGVHPEQHKTESTSLPISKARLPKRLVLPLHQHIGEPAQPCVKTGDKVLKGDIIAHAEGYVSVPLHAPTSGTIIDVGEYPIPHPSGLNAGCIVIEPDGEDRWHKLVPVTDYKQLDLSTLRNIIREAGIVGLGGAGFPSFIKLNPGTHGGIKTLILNGVECEPYITCDDMLMRENADDIVAGLHIMRHALQAEECIIAIETNKPQAYDALLAATENEKSVSVAQVPTLYPAGSEKQLIKVLTGQEVPSNGLALNIGIVCHNVATAAAVHKAIHLGQPLISRIVTITGNGVQNARNIEVLIGTPIDELIQQCKGDIGNLERVIMGGPMMGFALKDTTLPVIKTTNCIIADNSIAAPPPAQPCIRCGACADACPVSLLPQQLYWYSRAKDLEKAQDYNLFDCIECGCCSYVCPSNIPLVQYYRYAKGEIWSLEREKSKSDIARKRHDFRLERIDREKAEREAKRKKKKASLASKKETDTKQAINPEIQAALDRVQAKKQPGKKTATQSTSGNSE